MKLLDSLSNRRARPEAPAAPSEATSPGADPVPVDGYDAMKMSKVLASLPKHSQVELDAIETYESSHEQRPEVHNKLRYLRGDEPLEGYDNLEPDEISAALETANLETIGLVREYELKFRRRAPVLEALARIRHEGSPATPEG